MVRALECQHTGQQHETQNAHYCRSRPPAEIPSRRRPRKKNKTRGGQGRIARRGHVMNGPRLLSRGGVRVDDDDDDGRRCRDDDGDAEPPPPPPPSGEEAAAAEDDAVGRRRTTATVAAMAASTPITRYMWDDDGGDVARIHNDRVGGCERVEGRRRGPADWRRGRRRATGAC